MKNKLRRIFYIIFCFCIFVVGIVLCISTINISSEISNLAKTNNSFWPIFEYVLLSIFLGTYGLFMTVIGFVLLFDINNDRID